MKAVLAPVGTRGDVQPLVALAQALRARGHEVLVAAPANFAGWVGSLGLPFAPICEDFRTFLTGSPAIPVSPRFANEAPRMFAALLEASRGADVVVGAMLQLAGPSVAETLGVPYLTAVYCPGWLRSHEQLPILGNRLPRWLGRAAWATNVAIGWNPGYRKPVNRERANLGLPPVGDAHAYLFHSGRTLLAVDPAVVPVPRFDPPVGAERPVPAGFWLLDEPPLDDPALEAFLAAGPPPVYIGFGSVKLRRPDRVLTAVLDGVRAAGVRAIIGGGWAGLGAGTASDTVLAVGDVPFSHLFPRVAGVVHQGGAGTFALAARAGVPQFVAPAFGDQHYWGRLAARLGVGPKPVSLPSLSARRLATALGALSAPEAVTAARHTAELLAKSSLGAHTAAEMVEAAGAGRVTPPPPG